MRGDERGSEGLFSYIRLEDRIAADHPLGAIRSLVNEVLGKLSRRFCAISTSTCCGPAGKPCFVNNRLLTCRDISCFERWRIGCRLISSVIWTAKASVFSTIPRPLRLLANARSIAIARPSMSHPEPCWPGNGTGVCTGSWCWPKASPGTAKPIRASPRLLSPLPAPVGMGRGSLACATGKPGKSAHED